MQTYECEVCSLKCSSDGQLKEHMKNHTGERPYSCDICDKTFKLHKHLRRHLKSHNEDSHSCEQCRKLFASRDNLKRHIAVVHNEERKPQKCDECNKEIFSLKKHMQRFHNPKIFPCKICLKMFSSRKIMGEHSKIHIKRTREKCEICQKDVLSIKRHVRSMHQKA